MFKHLSIKRYFLLFSSILIVTALAIGTTSIITISNSYSSWHRYLDNVAERQNLLADVEVFIDFVETLNELGEGNSLINKEANRLAQEKLTHLSMVVENYMRLDVNGNEKAALDSLNRIIEKSQNLFDSRIVFSEQRADEIQGAEFITIEVNALKGAFGNLQKEYQAVIDQIHREVDDSFGAIVLIVSLGLSVSILLLVIFTQLISRNIIGSLDKVIGFAKTMSRGELNEQIGQFPNNEIGELANTLDIMQKSVLKLTEGLKQQDWLKSTIAEVLSSLQGKRSVTLLAQSLMEELPHRIHAAFGAFYYREITEDKYQAHYRLMASYAYVPSDDASRVFRSGEGIIGQCALDKKSKLYNDISEHDLEVSTGLGCGKPVSLYVAPLIFENSVLGIIEFASFEQFSSVEIEMLNQLVETLGILFSGVNESNIQKLEALG